MRKRLLALLICLCTVLACVPAVNAAESNVLISAGGGVQTGFESLESALAVATPGMTVTLQKDITAGRVLVPEGVRLNLNGYTLTADLVVVVYGQLYSSAAGAGKLAIPKNKLTIVGDNNGILPVWNPAENCYILAKASYQQMIRVSADYSYAQYIFIPNFDATTVSLLADGGADNGVTITVQLSWNNGACKQTYTFDEAMVKKVYSSYKDGVAGQVFMLTISGIAGISDMKVSAVAESTAGGAIRSATQIVNATVPDSFTVTFKDWNGTVLKTETVQSGKSATAPAVPTRKGYAFVGWDQTFNKVYGDLVVTAQYVLNITGPAIIIENVETHAGATEVEVTVTVKNNPGILGAVCYVAYDNSALKLDYGANGVTAEGVTFTKPMHYKNPTTFVWDAQDVTWTEDGVILTLFFSVSPTAESGSYHITLNYDPQDMFDGNGDPIDFVVIDGSVTVR